MAASNTFEKIAIIFIKTLNAIQKWRKMRQYPFCDRTWVNFDIQLNAEISIWMQSRFDGFDFSATLLVIFVTCYYGSYFVSFKHFIQPM